jgi:hypothetical protein
VRAAVHVVLLGGSQPHGECSSESENGTGRGSGGVASGAGLLFMEAGAQGTLPRFGAWARAGRLPMTEQPRAEEGVGEEGGADRWTWLSAAGGKEARQRLPFADWAGPGRGREGEGEQAAREKLGQQAEMEGREEGEGEFPFHFLK